MSLVLDLVGVVEGTCALVTVVGALVSSETGARAVAAEVEDPLVVAVD